MERYRVEGDGQSDDEFIGPFPSLESACDRAAGTQCNLFIRSDARSQPLEATSGQRLDAAPRQTLYKHPLEASALEISPRTESTCNVALALRSAPKHFGVPLHFLLKGQDGLHHQGYSLTLFISKDEQPVALLVGFDRLRVAEVAT